LTELGYMKDPPTRDFLRWNGSRFTERKKPVAENRDTPQRKSAALAQRKSATLHGTSAAEIRYKGAGESAAEIRYKSRLTTGWVGRVLSEAQTETLKLPLMTLVEGDGKRSWSTPNTKAIRLCAHCGGSGDLFQFKNGRHPVCLHRRCRRYWLRGVASTDRSIQ